MITTTLSELGNKLPIPIEKDGAAEFTFKPWRMREEKVIGELKKKHKGFGQFTRAALDSMLDSWNGDSWETKDEKARKLTLNQIPCGSIFYMYLYLRYDAMGEDFKIKKVICPSCGNEIDEYVADLSTLEVRCFDPKGDKDEDRKPDSPIVEYRLKKPFMVGEVKVEGLRIRHTPWDAFESVEKEKNPSQGLVKERMLISSIVGAVAEEVGNVELDKMKLINSLTKKDIEGLYSLLDEHNGGPVLALEMECGKCGNKWNDPLNWGYDYFFGSASL